MPGLFSCFRPLWKCFAPEADSLDEGFATFDAKVTLNDRAGHAKAENAAGSESSGQRTPERKATASSHPSKRLSSQVSRRSAEKSFEKSNPASGESTTSDVACVPSARAAPEAAVHCFIAPGTPVYSMCDVYANTPNVVINETEEVVRGPLIGSGSFGKVYKGKWRSRPVAIKVIHGQAASATSAQDWLQIEVELAMVLKHPNIVRCYYVSTPPVQGHSRMSFTKHFHIVDSARASLSRSLRSSQTSQLATPGGSFTSQPGTNLLGSMGPHAAGLLAVESAATLHAPAAGRDTQLVMEFCDQGSLADASISKRFFTMNGMAPNMRAILMRAKDIAAGMRYLHTCNVCHGDLKCENVLLQSDPTDPYGCLAKVGDFGLSGIMHDGRTHVPGRQDCGTISHTAPEVLASGQLCPASDVFSYGIILWEMVTAQTPFAGLRDAELSQRVLRGERPGFPAHIPRAFVQLVQDCWHQQPQQRINFDAVLARLRLLLKQADELQQECEAPLLELHSWLMTF